jgi:hypothetical protein
LSCRFVFAGTLVATLAVHVQTFGQSIYSTSFEPPTFTTGPLAPSAITPGQGNWQIDHTPSQVNIASGAARSGSQALRIDANPSAGSGGWVWYDPISLNPVALNKPIVTVGFSMWINSATLPSGGWGMDVFASNFNFMGRMQVSGANSRVFVERGLDGFVDTGAAVTKDVWNDYVLQFDFVNNIYDVLVNNTVVASDFPFTPQTGIIEDFDFRHNQAAAANDFALFDDFFVSVADAVNAPIEWINPAGGSWQTASNWSPAVVPGGVTTRARLGPVITAPRSIALNGQVTLDQLEIDSPQSYNITGLPVIGSWAMRFTGPTAEALVVKQGSHETVSPVLFEKNPTIQVDTGATFRFRSDFIVSGRTVTKTGGGRLRVRQVRADALAISTGVVETTGGGTFNGTSSVKSLTINAGAQLDLAAQKFVIDYTGTAPLDQVRQYLANGQIVDALLTDPRQAIAYGDNTVLQRTTLDDLTLDSSSVILQARLRGDATMDGTVDFNDLLALAQAYNGAGFWTNGDSDYSGTVSFNDLLALAQNYGAAILLSGDIITDASANASFESDWALARSLVPEPASLTVLAATCFITSRRRRRHA